MQGLKVCRVSLLLVMPICVLIATPIDGISKTVSTQKIGRAHV